VLTVSDRAFQGRYDDRGGPEVLRCIHRLIQSSWSSECRIVPDVQTVIEEELIDLMDRRGCHVVITTGGTGPSKRDVTPEATESVCDRMFPGFGEIMRSISLKYVPTAMLSRQTAGLRNDSFVINLPGNPGSIEQILPKVMASVAHCVHLAGGPRMVVSSPHVDVGHGSSSSSSSSTVAAIPATYEIDGANLTWLENILGGGEGKKESSEAASMTSIVGKILSHVRGVADQNHVFTKKRGCGRQKSKKKVELSLERETLHWLERSVKQFDLPNVGKGLRIVLDYVMEDEGVEASMGL
jgi:molybdopterin adenylyltransferase